MDEDTALTKLAQVKVLDFWGNDTLHKLACDHCGDAIGFIYEFDVQGSYFFCKSCLQTRKLELDGK